MGKLRLWKTHGRSCFFFWGIDERGVECTVWRILDPKGAQIGLSGVVLLDAFDSQRCLFLVASSDSVERMKLHFTNGPWSLCDEVFFA